MSVQRRNKNSTYWNNENIYPHQKVVWEFVSLKQKWCCGLLLMLWLNIFHCCCYSSMILTFSVSQVDELMAEDASGSEDENDDERDQRFRDTVLGSVSESGSSSDSLSGEFPRGWGLRRRSKSSPHASEDDLEKQQQKELEAETEDTENELVRFQKTVETFSPDSNSSQSSSADSIGSVDDEIAEAVEKEFLGSLWGSRFMWTSCTLITFCAWLLTFSFSLEFCSSFAEFESMMSLLSWHFFQKVLTKKI